MLGFDTSVGSAPHTESFAANEPGRASAYAEQFEAAQLVGDLLPEVEAAIAPLLSAHGLSPSSCPDDVLAIEGLVDAIVAAALPVVQRRTVSESPITSGASEQIRSWESPAGVLGFHVPSFGAKDVAGSPAERANDFVGGARQWGTPVRMASMKAPTPNPDELSLQSWGLGEVESSTARPLALDCATLRASERPIQSLRYTYDPGIGTDADPWRPPGVPQGEPGGYDCQDDTVRDCTEGERDIIDSAYYWLQDNISKIPSSFYGENYRSAIQAAFYEVPNYLKYKCNDCNDNFAFYDPDLLRTINFEKQFFDAPAIFSLLPILGISTEEFRGAILGHEATHLVDEEWFGKEAFEVGRASCNYRDCKASGEYRGAYVQAKLLGLNDCIAEGFGCGYMRSCGARKCDETTFSNAFYYVNVALKCRPLSTIWLIQWIVAIIATILIQPAIGLLAATLYLPERAVLLLFSLLLEDLGS